MMQMSAALTAPKGYPVTPASRRPARRRPAAVTQQKARRQPSTTAAADGLLHHSLHFLDVRPQSIALGMLDVMLRPAIRLQRVDARLGELAVDREGNRVGDHRHALLERPKLVAELERAAPAVDVE